MLSPFLSGPEPDADWRVVDMGFWETEDRRRAAAAGQELVDVLAAFGVELDDIEIIEPCRGCRRSGHRLNLGTVDLGTAREYAALLRPHAPVGGPPAEGPDEAEHAPPGEGPGTA